MSTIITSNSISGGGVDSALSSTSTNPVQNKVINTAIDNIKNNLGTAAAKDVPASGNATSTQVVMGNDTRLSDSRTPTSHTHGNIQNGGTLQTTDITIASGDKLVVTDSSDSSKVARTSVAFDGSTATKALTQKGTFETFATSDTKNTAGSTDTSSKIYLIGATSQAANPQTYSDNQVYAQDGVLSAKELKVTLKIQGGASNVVADRDSCIAFGYADSNSSIYTGNDDAGNGEGSLTVGTAYSGGTVHNEGRGSLVIGYATGSNSEVMIDSEVDGNFVYGYATNGGTIQVEDPGYGATAGGCVNGGSITASGIGAHAEGHVASSNGSIIASGNGAHAEGHITSSGGSTVASGLGAHAEGSGTTASGRFSHAEGTGTLASGEDSHAEGYQTTASGSYSHVEGQYTSASNLNSHAEGSATKASGEASHAEGYWTTASDDYSHAEGYQTSAKYIAHAEGRQTTASGHRSHAEGYLTMASEINSHAEGFHTTASGDASHAEGTYTIASSSNAHAEGNYTTASSQYSHAEGRYTNAISSCSHAEGEKTIASGAYSHAEGYYTTASNFASHSSGHYNAAMTTGGNYNNTKGTAFVIGNGTGNSARKNAFSVQYDGTVKAASTITASTTADYAEYFEWADENPNAEDRVGHFVTFDNDNKIRIANSNDNYILGIVSGEPFVLGNGDCDVWNGMVLRDDFRRVKYEPAPLLDEEGNPVVDDKGNPVYQGTRPIINPEYDPTIPYINRADRPEWAAIGMLGVLAVRDDGSCEVNGYCTINADGIATRADNNSIHKYRVIHRNSENVVEIVFR